MVGSHTFQLLLALASVALFACNDKFMAQSAREKTSALAAISTTVDEAGNISGTIDPNASVTQLLKFSSGELAGSAVAIPPGALSIPIAVTVGAGESLTSTQFLQDVGISNNSIAAAGPSVAFTPSQPVQATSPLTLSIPFSAPSSLSLTTGNEHIVVLYRWTEVVNGESSHSMGIIPAKDVVIAKDKVSFQTTKFGVFQLGRAEIKIAERVNVPSAQPPAARRDIGNPLVGTWGTCQSGLNRDNFSEPVFVKPTWTGINVGLSGVSLVMRGKSEPLQVTSHADENCTTNSTATSTPQVRGFLATTAISSNPSYYSYYSIKDAANNVSDSCQAVYPVSPFIDIEHVSRYFSQSTTPPTTTTQRLKVRWLGHASSYTFKVFSDLNCSETTPSILQDVSPISGSAQVDVAWPSNITASGFIKIWGTNPSIASECLELPPPLPALPEPPTNSSIIVSGISLSKYDPEGDVRLEWRRSPPGAAPSYRLEFFTSLGCQSGSNQSELTMSTSDDNRTMKLNDATKSIKISDLSVSENSPHVCVGTAKFPANQKPVFTGYNAGSRWIDLSWRSSNPVTLRQYSGEGCSGAEKIITINQPLGTQPKNRVSVHDLSPKTKYSFKISTNAPNPVYSDCQSVMTASANAPDWSSGNSQPVPATADFVGPEFRSTVTNGKTYKLRLSINGRAPVDSYSQVIPASGSAILLNVPAAVAHGQILTAWTPDGCSFVGNDGRRFPSLALPINSGWTVPTIICDGSSANYGGGGDSLGGYPTMSLVSKGVNVRITNGAFTMTEDLYESGNCSEGTRISSRVELGSFVLPGPDILKDTFPIDVTSKDLSGVMFTEAGVLAAKSDPNRFGCGLREWVKGQRLNLKDSMCGKEIGRTKYERLKVIGDRLYICEIPGDEDAYGMTPAMRIPSCEINEQSFFLKRQ